MENEISVENEASVEQIISHWHSAATIIETLILAGLLGFACYLAFKIFGRENSFVDDRDRGETMLMIFVFASAWGFFFYYKDKLSEEVVAGVAFALTNIVSMMGGYYWGKKAAEATTKKNSENAVTS